jgi:hypothetical protein
LSVLDDELVGFLRYEQLDRDTAIGGCSDRVLPGTVPSATILIVNSTRTRSMESRQSRSRIPPLQIAHHDIGEIQQLPHHHG